MGGGSASSAWMMTHGHRQRSEGIRHAYRVEDLGELNRILGQQYHVVVGNPPYITVKDRGLNQAYRERFSTCHRQYSLVVPFTERFFDLALYGADATASRLCWHDHRQFVHEARVWQEAD